MRKLVTLLGGISLAIVMAGTAQADKLLFTGTHLLEFTGGGSVSTTGTGVATVTGSGGGLHLQTLRLSQPFGAGLTATSGATGNGGAIRVQSVTISPFSFGVFAPISGGGGLTLNTMPFAGNLTLLASPSTLLPNMPGGQATGIIISDGIGGTRVSVLAAPWTVGSATVGTLMRQGFVHGPGSATSTTLSPNNDLYGGVIQLVTPTVVSPNIFQGSQGQIHTLTLRFAPEPGLLLLLGSGAVGVALLGRRRFRK